MGERIHFPVHCSVTMRTFIVAAEYTGGIVAWRRGFFQDGGRPTSGRDAAPDLRNVSRHDVINFTCPECGFRARANSEFWVCCTCRQLHCFGAVNGKRHGACGSCVHDTSAFAQSPDFAAASGDPLPDDC